MLRAVSAMSRSLITVSTFDYSVILSERGHADLCWDYSLHLVSEGKGGYTSWSVGCRFVGPKHPEEFIYPLAFS